MSTGGWFNLNLSGNDKRARIYALAVLLVVFFATLATAAEVVSQDVPREGGARGERGGTPIVIGNPEPEEKPLPEIDLSRVSSGDREEELLPALRPFHEEPSADRRPMIQTPPILAINVEGNSEVVTEHILSVTTSKPGMPFDENRLSRDASDIFDLGFFADVDYSIDDEPDGVIVTFKVVENPMVGEIHFFGNSVYSEDTLKALCFTQPGMIFNRTFFRNDLQRIKEKYQQDGYVMARVNDVKIEGTTVNVYITEPRLGEIIIQGNKRTKAYVIERQLQIKSGDIFNATRLRYTLGKLQGMGFFEDVNVGFEPSDDPDVINLVLTLEEAKTGRIGLSVGYGTQSGFSGGVSYSDNNWSGRGQRFGIGFELGDREQYWISLEQPYMDSRVFAWRFGAYKRTWDDLSYYDDNVYQFEYDENRKGAYAGFGRKFSERSKLSWYLTTEFQDVVISPHENAEPTPQQREEMQSGKDFRMTGVLQRDNMDPYLLYPKGDVEAIHIEKGMEALGGDWSYWKYWFEARYYMSFAFLSDIFERAFLIQDVPPIFAARLIAGDSDGYLPWAVDYTLGGDNTLRGYKDKRYRGDQIFLLNTEIRLPVQKNVSLVFFYDAGKAWDTTKGEDFDLGDLAKGYGIGVRVKTPIGNLRVDYAQGDDESRVHFGFGEMF